MKLLKNPNWFVYIIQCNDKTFYTGITNNLEKRIASHNAGTASRYTRVRTPVKLIYSEKCNNRSQASIREANIKRLSRKEKENLIKSLL